MAITSEIIGKLGGASVDVTPVNVTASGSIGSEVVMHTVTVPAGETWLIAMIGDVAPHYSSSVNSPEIYLGDLKPLARPSAGQYGLSCMSTGGDVIAKIKRNTGSGTDSFTGHVYAVKI